MQTNLAEFIKTEAVSEELDGILRSCVHCGFCNATCPTYQLLGDERDGPRGRIYLLKQLLEGEPVTQETQQHIDGCITCLACETTCPSGVQYGHLIDAGRNILESKVRRSLWQRLQRFMLVKIIPYSERFRLMYFFARLFRFVLPVSMRIHAIRVSKTAVTWPKMHHRRRVLLLDGCVQPVLAPDINAAAANVLDAIGISSIRLSATCCGALAYHIANVDEAMRTIRQHIDLCWPYVEQGIEAIISTASGCGSMIKEYGYLLQSDRQYASKAQRIAELTRDISEILKHEDLAPLSAGIADDRKRIAFHAPCSLQHGQKIHGLAEQILLSRGYELCEVEDAHICCGAGGAYSILQPTLSHLLRQQKQQHLLAGQPDCIATANIGCLHHLQAGNKVSVVHWIELLLP